MTQLCKGYKDDIGIDVCLDYDVRFEPFQTLVLDTGLQLPTNYRRSIMMCARTSAAMRGIIVSQCPIDPNYSGTAHIIAHNCSNEIVEFSRGEAFAQIYAFDIQEIPVDIKIKKPGIRENHGFGSTDKEETC